jgi:hypothetical protein
MTAHIIVKLVYKMEKCLLQKITVSGSCLLGIHEKFYSKNILVQ